MKLRYAESVVSAWLFAACANMHGGQSGDDGDVIDRGGGGSPSENPMPQEPDDGCSEERELEATTPSQLGKTPAELIAEVVPQSLPLHWVAYDAPSFDVDYEPGLGQTTLTLGLALRTPAATAAEEHITEFVPNNAAELTPHCAVPRVKAPIWLVLTSLDGAFDEKIPGTAVLYGNSIADVSASLPIEDVAGSFRFAPTVSNDAREIWSPTQLVLRVQLWPGGSAGSIFPEFVPTKMSGSNDIPVAQPPPDVPPDVDLTNTPLVPAQWNAVAVWPRLEQCAWGVARTPTDAVVGVSAQGVLDELSAHSSYALSVAENETDLAATALSSDVELSTLPALLCVTVDPLHQTVVFAVPAHLGAVDDASGSTEIDARLEVSITGQTNNRALTKIYFERSLSETAASASRSEIEAATGMSLESIDSGYSQFWWTWYGHLTRDTAVGTRDQETHLVVSSPNAEETRLVAEQAAQGGPGFGVSSSEQSVQLPGDVLFHAASVP